MNIIQALEQMQATLRDLSPVLWSYKENLVKQGFTEEQAFALVKDYQNTILSNGK
ncbi:hypothetical protein GJU40_01590 [Bacillus lacus]|uniref:Uncharacterized protein n=1 Tax=Metabacillus lacus TaxID=1983721 RepID=A0A7X2IWA6_9BACI|nr:hypothetical protein [Metabacillus lacus]MRX70859.1 hypothetical protein [Metabacillus lacus]